MTRTGQQRQRGEVSGVRAKIRVRFSSPWTFRLRQSNDEPRRHIDPSGTALSPRSERTPNFHRQPFSALWSDLCGSESTAQHGHLSTEMLILGGGGLGCTTIKSTAAQQQHRDRTEKESRVWEECKDAAHRAADSSAPRLPRGQCESLRGAGRGSFSSVYLRVSARWPYLLLLVR